MYPFPILGSMTESLRRKQPLDGFVFMIVQHVLPDLMALLESLVGLGADPDGITVVGIPYSSHDDVATEIRRRFGCKVVLPKDFPFDGVVAFESMNLYKDANVNRQLLILEDGGYAVPQFIQLAESGVLDPSRIRGAVEQTSRGAWIDREYHRRLRRLPFPVIDVSCCGTKKKFEPPYIADAAIGHLRTMLDAVGIVDINPAGVLGYGAIGSKVAQRLRESGIEVLVREVDSSLSYEANMDGFSVLTNEKLPKLRLVVGSTGKTSIDREILGRLRGQVALASTSSRRVEIDVDTLQRGSVISPWASGPHGPSVIDAPAARIFQYQHRTGCGEFPVLFDGYPVNFYGESLPEFIADGVLALLLAGLVKLTDPYCLVPGINPGHSVLFEDDVRISNELKSVIAGIEIDLDVGWPLELELSAIA